MTGAQRPSERGPQELPSLVWVRVTNDTIHSKARGTRVVQLGQGHPRTRPSSATAMGLGHGRHGRASIGPRLHGKKGTNERAMPAEAVSQIRSPEDLGWEAKQGQDALHCNEKCEAGLSRAHLWPELPRPQGPSSQSHDGPLLQGREQAQETRLSPSPGRGTMRSTALQGPVARMGL